VAKIEKKYKQDPILEVICEFQFVPAPRDLTIPGLLYERVKGSFPIKKACQVLNHQIVTQPGKLPEPRVSRIDRTQFWSNDEKAVVQTSDNFVCINHQTPYPTWKGYFPMVQEGLAAYMEAAGNPAIKSIGLRYINKIDVPERPMHMADYFALHIGFPEGLETDYDDFSLALTIPGTETGSFTRVQLSSAPRPEGLELQRVILDLDHRVTYAQPAGKDTALDRVDKSHMQLRDMFESFITAKTRRIFGRP